MSRQATVAHAENILITGGNFISTTQNYPTTVDAGQTGIDVLRRHSALGALHDSAERIDPPRCHPETRVAFRARLEAWASREEESSSFLWLYGPAGSGKTALAQWLSEHCSKTGRLAATFFFARTAANRSDGRPLIPTLAFQLSQSLPTVCAHIKKAVERDSGIFQRTHGVQMQKLIIEPLNKASKPSKLKSYIGKITGAQARTPRVIIIDGLDECSDIALQGDLLQVLGKAVRDLVLPFKFFVASRAEPHICQAISLIAANMRMRIVQMDLSDDTSAQEDIGTYLERELKEIRSSHPFKDTLPPGWPKRHLIEELTSRASGQFIYANIVVKYVRSIKHKPADRLNIILNLSSIPHHDTPFSQLDALYEHILSSVESANVTTVLEILSILTIPRRSNDDFTEFPTPAVLEKLLLLQPGDIKVFLVDLASLVHVGSPNEPIRIMHASFVEFLLDPRRSKQFHANIGNAHAKLAIGCIRHLESLDPDPLIYDPDVQSKFWTPIIAHSMQASLSNELYHAGRTDMEFLWSWLSSFFLCLSSANVFALAHPPLFIQHIKQYSLFLFNKLRPLVEDPRLDDMMKLASGVEHMFPAIQPAGSSSPIARVPFNAELIVCLRPVRGVQNSMPAVCTLVREIQYLTLLCQFLEADAALSDLPIHGDYGKAALRVVRNLYQRRPRWLEVIRPKEQSPFIRTYELEDGLLDCATTLISCSTYCEELIYFLLSHVIDPRIRVDHGRRASVLEKEVSSYLKRTMSERNTLLDAGRLVTTPSAVSNMDTCLLPRFSTRGEDNSSESESDGEDEIIWTTPLSSMATETQ
ncbi:hypothetical protein NLJ89_g11080 [Agrocybe chaxingu]|uniref:Nephrocystin 3-like N-terminal domain-containing protein n=1 Tax=Agrocybe chaxingu TaxID=84603 RepID=A0A9W8MRH6_9AGAR|nr:hypothetical protein NLJ89_g11080 [Agrocybe chaxingu]